MNFANGYTIGPALQEACTSRVCLPTCRSLPSSATLLDMKRNFSYPKSTEARPMPASFRSFNASVLWRAVSIACVMMAFSYIFFEVLDLDGSNFPLQRHPVESTAIVSEVETNIVRPYLTRLVEPWTEVSFFLPTRQVDWVHPRLTENLIASTLNILQHRGYRAALPRSSIPDHFLFHA